MMGIILLVLLIGGVAAGPIMSQVEQPDYDVIATIGNVEIRHYAPFIAAHVTVNGTRDTSVSQGFKALASYIFGGNQSQADIPMTAPVTQQAIRDHTDTWQISFIMPSSYTIDSLPAPDNATVSLEPVASRYIAAISFSGVADNETIARYEATLQTFLQQHDVSHDAQGTPLYAFYNPPWTLPPLRRNEVLIRLDAHTAKALAAAF